MEAQLLEHSSRYKGYAIVISLYLEVATNFHHSNHENIMGNLCSMLTFSSF